MLTNSDLLTCEQKKAWKKKTGAKTPFFPAKKMPHGLESITSDDQHLQITLSIILTNFFVDGWLYQKP